MAANCPDWIFDISCARACVLFLSQSHPLLSSGKHFCQFLSADYENVDPNIISDLAEQMIRFLSEVDAGEDAVIFLDGFIYFRLNYESTTKPRNLKPMFGNPEAGVAAVNQIDALKRFKAYVFGLRSNNSPTPPPGWSMSKDSENLKNVSALVTTSINPLDFL